MYASLRDRASDFQIDYATALSSRKNARFSETINMLRKYKMAKK